jgi:hypothetical protein
VASTDQYTIKYIPTNGGGGSSSKKFTPGNNRGPINTALIGTRTEDATLFHATGESSPVLRIESGG